MKIKFKTGGLLSDILPPGTDGDETFIDLQPGATAIDVMKHFDLPEDEFYLVILNDEVLPKPRRPETELKEGDELGIFPPLKGG